MDLIESGVLEASAFFKDVSALQMAQLRTISQERKFVPGEALLHEGSLDPFVYVITRGSAAIVKNTSFGEAVTIHEVSAGDVLGELKIIDPQPSSSSVVATTPVTAIEIDLQGFTESSVLIEIRDTLLKNVARILATRLRATTGENAEAMQRELVENRARVYAGRFIVLIFTMMAIYQLALAALALVPSTIRPRTSVLSFGFAIWSAIPVVSVLWHTPYPLKSYGLTWYHCGRIALQALVWTVPMLLLVVILKWALIQWSSVMTGQPLFDPGALFADRPFDLAFYVMGLCLYAIHAPLQEFIVRAGFQGTLQNFMPTSERINWRAIIISNLLFASAHSFIGFWFCIAAFVPGLFWGWMFAKQGSIIGVAVSHTVFGIWAIFIVGVRMVIGG